MGIPVGSLQCMYTRTVGNRHITIETLTLMRHPTPKEVTILVDEDPTSLSLTRPVCTNLTKKTIHTRASAYSTLNKSVYLQVLGLSPLTLSKYSLGAIHGMCGSFSPTARKNGLSAESTSSRRWRNALVRFRPVSQTETVFLLAVSQTSRK